MGVIRGVLLVIVSVLMFLSIFMTALSWTLSLSLTYDNVQKESTVIIKDVLQNTVNISQIMDETYPAMIYYCQQNNTDYVFNSEGYTFDISCETAFEGKDAILDEGIESFIRNTYYTKYDCKFLNCLSSHPIPLFLISEMADKFWYEKFYLFLTLSIVLIVLSFVLIEKKSNLPILSGALAIVASLPFFKLDSLSQFSDNIIFKFLDIFFSQSFYVAIRFLLVGIAFVILGIVFKIFKLGFFISKFFDKFKQLKGEFKKDTKKESKKEEKSSNKKSK